jgi:hypothetical protein
MNAASVPYSAQEAHGDNSAFVAIRVGRRSTEVSTKAELQCLLDSATGNRPQQPWRLFWLGSLVWPQEFRCSCGHLDDPVYPKHGSSSRRTM